MKNATPCTIKIDNGANLLTKLLGALFDRLKVAQDHYQFRD